MIDSPPPEVMQSIASIADRDGVSKQAISTHVARLIERHNLTVTRDGRGRVALVNVVEYDTLRERYADPSKAQAPRRDEDGEAADELPAPRPSAAPPAKNSYEEARRRRAWFEVEKRRLELSEQRGQLIRADRYAEAVGRCSDELVRLIDQLPQEADAVAVSLDFDDVHRVRLALKGLARSLRDKLAAAFEALASDAPALDEPIEDTDEGIEA